MRTIVALRYCISLKTFNPLLFQILCLNTLLSPLLYLLNSTPTVIDHQIRHSFSNLSKIGRSSFNSIQEGGGGDFVSDQLYILPQSSIKVGQVGHTRERKSEADHWQNVPVRKMTGGRESWSIRMEEAIINLSSWRTRGSW